MCVHTSPRYSIQRNGARNMSSCPMMDHGNSLGPGIYMAKKGSHSLTYSQYLGYAVSTNAVLGVLEFVSEESTTEWRTNCCLRNHFEFKSTAFYA